MSTILTSKGYPITREDNGIYQLKDKTGNMLTPNANRCDNGFWEFSFRDTSLGTVTAQDAQALGLGDNTSSQKPLATEPGECKELTQDEKRNIIEQHSQLMMQMGNWFTDHPNETRNIQK
ncbi:unnamed protein product, partial [Meganyctiphanes norvegica]